MKKVVFLFLAILFLGCNPREFYTHEYETEPVFYWGYSEFWGPYYQKYGVDANICSLSLFSDSLSIDSTGALVGFGQYLFLEDIYYGSNSVFLQEGEYQVSMDADSMSIVPGEEKEIDGMKFEAGAHIYFIEKDSKYTVYKRISGGTMRVNYEDSLTIIDCNFELEDQTLIKGSFRAVLPYFDYSSINSGGLLFTRPKSVRIIP